MKTLISYLLFATSLSLQNSSWITNNKGMMIPNDGLEFQRVATEEGHTKFIVIFFYLTTCPNCVKFQPIWNRVVDEIDILFGSKILFVQVDGAANSLTASRYGVHRYPSLVII